jgi:hypothetical protein
VAVCARSITTTTATYYDAADQAGISRRYGGIHVAADDVAGRRIGSKVGKQAYALAGRYFAGTARSETACSSAAVAAIAGVLASTTLVLVLVLVFVRQRRRRRARRAR